MNTKKTPIVFFGNERLATSVQTGVPTLTSLIEAGYDVKAVVSSHEKGISRSARQLEIKDIADAHNIPVLLPDKPREILDQLRSYNAIAAVLVAYGKIVPQDVIDVFPRGIINIHPSLLPLHRGPTPLESVILNGEAKTGVSLMSLVRAMDAGPIYGQSELKLDGKETKQQLADRLLDVGASMVIELLPGIISGDIVAIPQDDQSATYDKLLTKEDGAIQWSKPAEMIDREIRAFADWPKSRTTLADKEVTITAAHLIDGSGTPGKIEIRDKDLVVYCGDQALAIDRIKPAGKNEMTSEAFIAGHRRLLE